MNFLKCIVLLGTCFLGSSLSAQVASSESYLDAPGPTGSLKGTLLTPALKSALVVLIIPGSGPTDRDGLAIVEMPIRLIWFDCHFEGG
jgi:hypothetical protein